jgi:ATP-dependent Clp protease ATP-binding subunit ClpB
MNAKFTQVVEKYLSEAAGLAQEEQHQQLQPLHLAIPMLEDPGGIFKQAVIKASGQDAYAGLMRTLRKRLVRLPRIDPAPDDVFPSKDFSAMLKKAQKLQRDRGDTYLGADTLLLALLGDSDIGQLLGEVGIVRNAVETALKEVRPLVSSGRGLGGGGTPSVGLIVQQTAPVGLY